MEKHSVVSVDIAKTVFDVAQLPASTVVMEACGMAHYWARKLRELGHSVVLLPPHQVRPYVTRNKTDRADAKGILEAYRNADIRPVPVKSVAQQVLCSLHRFRSGWSDAGHGLRRDRSTRRQHQDERAPARGPAAGADAALLYANGVS